MVFGWIGGTTFHLCTSRETGVSGPANSSRSTARKHLWFENRGSECTLIAYIDDATSRLMHAAFVPSESTLDYLRETRTYVARFGRPIAFYSDKHAIFRVNKREAASGDGMTQFGRALHELNIDIICANSPAAKGRIERSFGTLQDRLVKELRLAGVSTIEAGNAFLPGFLAIHNERFGKSPFSDGDAHRPLPAGQVLAAYSPGRKSGPSRRT